MLPCKYNPRRHFVEISGETEIGRWLEREFPETPGLFLYLHLETGNWVIARWLNDYRCKFHDVLNLGYDFRRFSRDESVELRRRLSGRNYNKQIKEAIANYEYREARRLTDQSYISSEKRRKRKVQVLGGL
jgi:hypothetical protein